MSEKKWFYVTVEKVQRYNITVQAEDEHEAVETALESPYDEDLPDDTFSDVVHVEEVNRYVE